MKHNGRMSLIGRIFGGKDKDGEAVAGGGSSMQFHESEPGDDDSQPSRNAPRRELVQVVLRDTMRKHGIPSDWIECRILSTVSRTGRQGLHVNFVVRQAHEQLLAYVFAFQDSFEREISRYDARCRDWLVSLGWEFQGVKMDAVSDPKGWVASAPAPLTADLPSPDLPAFDVTEDPAGEEPPKTDEDIQRDLQALFAIRDAAMADTARPARPPQPDFQPTQPNTGSGERS
ncbi:MAG: hypothetical protein JWP41_663 [Ramlibacter sp.]|jgi:hypothetical protein|nr:hypothetical protein [Ramlibacter sp.]